MQQAATRKQQHVVHALLRIRLTPRASWRIVSETYEKSMCTSRTITPAAPAPAAPAARRTKVGQRKSFAPARLAIRLATTSRHPTPPRSRAAAALPHPPSPAPPPLAPPPLCPPRPASPLVASCRLASTREAATAAASRSAAASPRAYSPRLASPHLASPSRAPPRHRRTTRRSDVHTIRILSPSPISPRLASPHLAPDCVAPLRIASSRAARPQPPCLAPPPLAGLTWPMPMSL